MGQQFGIIFNKMTALSDGMKFCILRSKIMCSLLHHSKDVAIYLPLLFEAALATSADVISSIFIGRPKKIKINVSKLPPRNQESLIRNGCQKS